MLITQNTPLDPEQEELMIIVNNDPQFHDQLAKIAANITPLLFKTIGQGFGKCEVFLFWRLNPMSYTRLEGCSYIFWGAVKQSCEREGYTFSYNNQNVVSKYFEEYILSELQRGADYLPQPERDILENRFTNKMSYKALSKLCGMSVYKIKKVLENWNTDTYSAFKRCSQGREPYQIVMGHCKGFICDQPKFRPYEKIVTEEQAKILEGGDLVADIGSSRYAVVSHPSSGGHCVFCKGDIKVLPVRRIPKRYKPFLKNANTW